MSAVQDIFFIRDPETNLKAPNYGPDPKKPFSQFTVRENFELIIDKMEDNRKIETLKSVGNFVVSLCLSAAAAIAAYITSGIALILLKPGIAYLAIPNPYGSLILMLSGLAIGAGVGYFLYSKYAKPYFTATQQHWNFSEKFVDHIDNVKNYMFIRFPKR